ncbi:DUF2461 domain-containing protein [Flavilitoribacter nigricans]|uniref:TIGR02453 family protein n=1 Tax=Flavilitoribacter nigricans (strain ATCC 23147 / DSM 23189 / NBRC 102662 / NCIMB 1420 / SS-2) TaxID=1122177 RepID=A0A2D0N8E7_FLAN2|nr:DUF2461 domain-containing protein [Flavilitoribacter nigricans]PHN04755.1 TIGR02453 family protein [Flavilitoribacter nigricans DSM 23189 = NBRC 102662]
MPITAIPKSTLSFLEDLKDNNNRPWFNDHKERYQQEHAYMVEFAENLIARMTQHDLLEPMSGKKSLFRIYRDTRFSKDKTPYKSHFSGSLKRATKLRRGGYYYHIQPGGSFLGGGFWGPSSADLQRIREEIAADAQPLRDIIADDTFQQTFGDMKGVKVKTSPKGYTQDHPNIDLIRHKQFIVTREFTDKQVMSPDFLDQVVDTFQAMRPFFDYMSEVLTTDSNGVPIV